MKRIYLLLLLIALNSIVFAQTTSPPSATSESNKTATRAEETAWNLVKDSDKAEDINFFLQEFPNGYYSDAAKFKIKIIERKEWVLVKDSGDIAKVQDFLRRFPDRRQCSGGSHFAKTIAV